MKCLLRLLLRSSGDTAHTLPGTACRRLCRIARSPQLRLTAWGLTVLACPSPKCGSTNVQQLAHYWESLAADSPLKARYAPPAAVESRAWIALAAVVVGIVLLVNGTVLAGLLIAIGGLGFGVFDRREVAVYQHSRAAWEADRICLGCTGRF